MKKHMHEKENPPTKPLCKTAVLWQSIFSVFCGLAFLTLLETLGAFTFIILYPFLSFIWSFVFMIVSVRKKRFLRGLIPLLLSAASLFPWFCFFYAIYLIGEGLAS